MPMIRECIVTTLNEEGRVHIAPLGLIAAPGGDGDGWIIAPFRPSATLDNLRATPFAVANFIDDVMIFAGCLTGNKDWPTRASTHVPGAVLEAALSHAELAADHVEEDELRPRFHCRVVHEVMHAPFKGFNRAQAAVIEAAILSTRSSASLATCRSPSRRPPARASTRPGGCSSRRSRTTTSTPRRPDFLERGTNARVRPYARHEMRKDRPDA